MQIPIHHGLFTWPAERPELIGSRCQSCAEVAFPAQMSCAACTGDRTEEIRLSRTGTLWTWTIQHFPPPVPFLGPTDRESFVPFGVGYVELPEGIRIEGRLTLCDASKLEIGMDMELCLEPFIEDDEGRERMTFAWRPVTAGQAAAGEAQ